MIHQWVYVIAPVISGNYPPLYFAAYCKGCNKYYTEPIPINRKHRLSPAHLPRDGCTGGRAPELPTPDLELIDEYDRP